MLQVAAYLMGNIMNTFAIERYMRVFLQKGKRHNALDATKELGDKLVTYLATLKGQANFGKSLDFVFCIC